MKITRRQLRNFVQEQLFLEMRADVRKQRDKIVAEFEAAAEKARLKNMATLRTLITGEEVTPEQIANAEAQLDDLLKKISAASTLNRILDKYDEIKADHPYIFFAGELVLGIVFPIPGMILDSAGMYQALRSGDPQQVMGAGLAFIPGIGDTATTAQEATEGLIKFGGSKLAEMDGTIHPDFANTLVAKQLEQGIAFRNFIKKVNDSDESDAFKKQFFAAIGDIAEDAKKRAPGVQKKIENIGLSAFKGVEKAVKQASGDDAMEKIAQGARRAKAEKDVEKVKKGFSDVYDKITGKTKKKTVSENITSSQILKEWIS